MAAFQPRESVALRARNKRSTTAIPVPEVQQYGVFTPGYAGYLQSTAGASGPSASAALAAGNAAALRMNADAEQAAYANMLSRAQDLQIEAQKRDIYAEAKGEEADRRIQYLNQGAPIDIENITQDASGETQYGLDPDKTAITNATGMSQRVADIYGKNAETVGKMIEGGYGPTNEAAGHLFPNFVTGEPMQLGPRIKPSDENTANFGETAAQRFARETAIENIKASGSGKIKVKSVLNETGDQVLYEISGEGPNSVAEVEAAKAEARRNGVPLVGDPPPAAASPNAGAQGGGAPATSAAAIPPGDLSDYRDPGYDAIENRLERKYNLPTGLMKRIRVFGERSNASQVSPSGARTVYQILPSTRKLFGDKYKIDAYAGPAEAAEIAALHLKESIDRGEDPVRGYNGGPKSGGRWNTKENNDYAARVNSGQALASVRPNQPQADDVRIAKWKTFAQVADAQRQDDGSIAVTLKNGKVVRYRNGRRVA